MKKIFIVITSLLLLSFVYSCYKTENIKQATNKKEQKEIALKNNSSTSSSTETKIHCEGNCNCGLEGILGGANDYIQCRCDKCIMIIEKTSMKNGKKYITELKDAQLEIPYIKELAKYIKTKHNRTDYSIKEATLYNYEDHKAVNYYYELDNGVVDDVIFARNKGGTISISCNGSCDCRSQYIFSNPPKAECSCADCVMDVTKVEDVGK